MEDDPTRFIIMVYWYSYSIETTLKFILLYFYVPFYDSRIMYYVELLVRSRFAVAWRC